MKKMIVTIVCCIALLFVGLTACDDSNITAQNPPQALNANSSTSDGTSDALCNDVQYKLACLSIVRRYKYLDDPNKYGYFYGFIANDPVPVIEYVVQGSVFAVSDLVSNPNYKEYCNDNGSTGSCAIALDKRQPDGTYGTNGTAMFGWTASGSYFEWDGPYAYSQTPMNYENIKIYGCKAGIAGC